VEVQGTGGLTIRRNGNSRVLSTGSRSAVSELGNFEAGESDLVSTSPTVSAEAEASGDGAKQPSLERDLEEHRAHFDEALEQRDVDEAVAALLAVEQSIQDWSADTLQSDSIDRARRELRAMVVRLGALAKVGVVDPATIVAPLVEQILAARRAAREAKDYAASDVLRDVLTQAGVSVNDTPDGVSWEWTAN
jgi:cysteinyl-tRNA synthetase